jgi:hypothetical protein
MVIKDKIEAEGILFQNGKVVIRWLSGVSSIVIHDSLENFIKVSVPKVYRKIQWISSIHYIDKTVDENGNSPDEEEKEDTCTCGHRSCDEDCNDHDSDCSCSLENETNKPVLGKPTTDQVDKIRYLNNLHRQKMYFKKMNRRIRKQNEKAVADNKMMEKILAKGGNFKN